MEKLLENIIATPVIYARFLNTLSLLEYIGARKILKSQHYQLLNTKLLSHMSEEMRHAQILKRAAMKISPDCDTYMPKTLLCEGAAYHYFQTVDHAPAAEFNEHNPWHCYLYTTSVIEIRALNFYGIFEKVLKKLGNPSVFRGILAEEKRHLEQVSDWLHAIPNYSARHLERLKEIEEREFGVFLSAVEDYVRVGVVL